MLRRCGYLRFRSALAIHRRAGALSAGEIFEIVERAERMMHGKDVPVDSRCVAFPATAVSMEAFAA